MDDLTMPAIHDAYCRCRYCKPALVGERSARALRLRIYVALAIMLAVAAIAITH